MMAVRGWGAGGAQSIIIFRLTFLTWSLSRSVSLTKCTKEFWQKCKQNGRLIYDVCVCVCVFTEAMFGLSWKPVCRLIYHACKSINFIFPVYVRTKHKHTHTHTLTHNMSQLGSLTRFQMCAHTMLLLVFILRKYFSRYKLKKKPLRLRRAQIFPLPLFILFIEAISAPGWCSTCWFSSFETFASHPFKIKSLEDANEQTRARSLGGFFLWFCYATLKHASCSFALCL